MRPARLSFRLAAAAVAVLVVFAHAPAVAAPSPKASPDSLGVIGFGGSALILGDQVLIGRPGILVGFPMPADSRRHRPCLRPRGGRLGGERDAGREGRHAGGRVRLRARRGEEPPGRRCAGSGRRWSGLRVRARLGWAVERAGTTDREGRGRGRPAGCSRRAPWGCAARGRTGTRRRSAERSSSSPGAGVPASGRSAGPCRPSATAAGDWFGAAVAFDGQRALVGAPGGTTAPLDSTRLRPGQAFVFRSAGAKWSEEARLTPPTPGGQWFDGGGGPARRHRGTRRRAAGGQSGRHGSPLHQAGHDLEIGRHHRSRLHHPAGRLRILAGPR